MLQLRLGDHLKIRRGLYSHHGIYVGNRRVIHFSGVRPRKTDARIQIATLEEFAAPASVHDVERVAYGRCFRPETVVALAFSRLGSNGYDLFRNNCEGFAHWCKTGRLVSDQGEVGKAAGGGVAGSTAATVAAAGIVSAAGVVAGTSAAGVMSGLASVGGAVGGGAAAGVAVLAAAPAAIAARATHLAFRDDPTLPPVERSARLAARRAATLGGIAGAFSTIGVVSAAGVPGLSAVGIATGLSALGGSMMGGVVVATAAPAAAAAGIAYLVYRLVGGRG